MNEDMEYYIQELRKRKDESSGSLEDAEKQHNKGRLTARERIDLLFDPDTFEQIDALVGCKALLVGVTAVG